MKPRSHFLTAVLTMCLAPPLAHEPGSVLAEEEGQDKPATPGGCRRAEETRSIGSGVAVLPRKGGLHVAAIVSSGMRCDLFAQTLRGR